MQKIRIHNLPYEKVGNNEPVCIADEVPFEIPESWEWARLSVVNDIYTGNSINESEKKIKYTGLTSGYYYIGTKDVGFDHTIDYDNSVRIPYGLEKFRVAPQNSILMCIEGGSAGRKISFTNQDVCFGNKLCCFVSLGIECLFLYYYLQSPLFQVIFKENTTGIIGGVSVNTLKSLFFPIPPLQEQKRIVEKLIQIEPFLNTYAEAEETIEKLNTSFPELLKKSILQEAVQGKLVPQDENDEPASVLLERIRTEKQALIQAGKIKKDKNESIIFRRDNSHYEKLDGIERCTDDEILFDIPESWVWTSVGEVCTNIQYGSSQKSSPTGKIAVLRMGNLQNGRIVLDKLVYTSDSKEIEKYPLEYNDLLFNRTNSKELVGKVAIYKSEIPAIYAGYLVRLHPILINSDYLNYVMQSQYYWIYCQNVRSDAIGQSNINAEKLKRFIFPLPPLQEQRRIVNQISCAMSKIEHL